MGADDARNDENPIDMVAREVAVLIRLAESARKGLLTLDRSAYQLLGAIAAHNALALGTLAELLHLDVSTVSRQVAMLENKDLVERSADRGDGRVSLLAITETGKTQLQAARAARHDLFAQVLADWSDDELQALGATLLRLNEAIARHGSGSQKGMPRAMVRES